MEQRPLLFLQPPALPTTNEFKSRVRLPVCLCVPAFVHATKCSSKYVYLCIAVCVRVRLQGPGGRQMLLLSEHNELLIGR